MRIVNGVRVWRWAKRANAQIAASNLQELTVALPPSPDSNAMKGIACETIFPVRVAGPGAVGDLRQNDAPVSRRVPALGFVQYPPSGHALPPRGQVSQADIG